MLFIIFNLWTFQSVLAEYRVYQYLVSNNDPAAITSKPTPKYITSTLNPSVYKNYVGGNSIKVSLLRTWICPGYTGAFQETCSHPYDQEMKKDE